MTNAHHQPELFAARNSAPHFTIAVRVDGKRSHVETHASLDVAMDAGKQYLWNDDVAWLIVGYHEKRIPYYSHRMVRRGEEIIVRGWDGLETKVGRQKVRAVHPTTSLA